MKNLLKWIETTLVLLVFALIALFFFARSFVESFESYYLIAVVVTMTMFFFLIVFSSRTLMVEFDTDDNQP